MDLSIVHLLYLQFIYFTIVTTSLIGCLNLGFASLTLYPKEYILWHRLGLAYENIGESTLAKESFDKAKLLNNK